jgi:hypothetical protein
VLVSITYVLVSIICVGENDMCWRVLYVLVSLTYVLMSIAYVLVSITCVGEHNICVDEHSM